MLKEADFPDLSTQANNRGSGRLVAKMTISGIPQSTDNVTFLLASTFVRMVDVAIYEYQLARESYFGYYNEPNLGSSVSISERLLPAISHLENCISNTTRALKICDSLRQREPSENCAALIKREEWRPLEAMDKAIRDIRDSIQHADERLLEGLPAGGVFIDQQGIIKIASNSLALTDFTRTLLRLRTLSVEVVNRTLGPSS